MLEAVFSLIGVLAIAAVTMVRGWPWTLAASVFLLAETGSIWMIVAFFGRITIEIRKRKSS
jgi:hypothetical protein